MCVCSPLLNQNDGRLAQAEGRPKDGVHREEPGRPVHVQDGLRLVPGGSPEPRTWRREREEKGLLQVHQEVVHGRRGDHEVDLHVEQGNHDEERVDERMHLHGRLDERQGGQQREDHGRRDQLVEQRDDRQRRDDRRQRGDDRRQQDHRQWERGGRHELEVASAPGRAGPVPPSDHFGGELSHGRNLVAEEVRKEGSLLLRSSDTIDLALVHTSPRKLAW